MIVIKPLQLSFTASFVCADCRKSTSVGLVYRLPEGSWQLVPLCRDHLRMPVPGKRTESPMALQHLERIRHNAFARKRERVTQTYTQLRREHASGARLHKARRTLNRLYQCEEAER